MITKDFINDIRLELATLISDAQDTLGADAVFESVYAYPVSTMEGFPAVVVMLNENNVNFTSTGSNDSRRIYLTFSLNIYYPVQKESESQDAEMAMGEAVSELFRILCIKHPLTTVDLASVGNTEWGDTVLGEATFRTAQVIINVSKFVDSQ